MTTTISDLPTLQLRLAEAELALHKLLTGKQKVQVMYALGGNHSVTYQQTQAGDLRAYISELRATIASVTGIGERRPIHWS